MAKYSSEELQQMAKTLLIAKREQDDNYLFFVMAMCTRTNLPAHIIDFAKGEVSD